MNKTVTLTTERPIYMVNGRTLKKLIWDEHQNLIDLLKDSVMYHFSSTGELLEHCREIKNKESKR